MIEFKSFIADLDGRTVLYHVPTSVVEIDSEQERFYLLHPDASIEEILNKELVAPTLTLDDIKRLKLEELAVWKFRATAAGYTDEYGRTWGIADADRRAWQELLAAATQLLALQESDSLPTPIREIDGVTMHAVTLAEYKAILRGVAQAYMQIDAAYATLHAQLRASSTIEEAQSISIPQ